MSLTFIFFSILAILSIASAIVTIASKHPVTSAISLIFNFFMLAGLYLTLQAQFIAVIQILVYAGAIMVLVIFVIMLLNLGDEKSLTEQFNYRKLLGMLFAPVIIVQFIAIFLAKPHIGATIKDTIEFNGKQFSAGSVELIGQVLYTNYLFPFEAIGILLIAAIVGAIVLAKRNIN